MTEQFRHIEAFWAVRGGKRFVVANSETLVSELLENCWAYGENGDGWSFERTTEIFPVVQGELFVAQSSLVDAESGKTLADGIAAPHVAWECPYCGRPHTTDLCRDMECQTPPLVSPQLWACEIDKGWKLVWVEW
ncbi:MAG: hypothetical protein WD875_02250 [Pirellulales bacterium]